MQGLDLVMTASAQSEAPKIDEVPKFAIMERPSLTMPFNVTGSPAMSVCCGFGEGGLPLSAPETSGAFDDFHVLRAADACEAREFRGAAGGRGGGGGGGGGSLGGRGMR